MNDSQAHTQHTHYTHTRPTPPPHLLEQLVQQQQVEVAGHREAAGAADLNKPVGNVQAWRGRGGTR